MRTASLWALALCTSCGWNQSTIPAPEKPVDPQAAAAPARPASLGGEPLAEDAGLAVEAAAAPADGGMASPAPDAGSAPDASDAGAPTSAPGPANAAAHVVDGPAGKLRYTDDGQGKGAAIVFVHGLGGDLTIWGEEISHLKDSHRCVALDLRAHGGSEPAKDGDYSARAFAGDVGAVVRAAGLTKFWLVGHSLAGHVITAYAARHPAQVEGLVYIDAAGDLRKAPPALKAWLLAEPAGFGPAQVEADYSRLLGDRAKPDTRRAIFAAVKHLPVQALLRARHAMASYPASDDAAKFHGPKFAIDVEGNDFPFSAARTLPGLRQTLMKNVSHWPMLDDPRGFDEALRRIIQ